MLPNIVIGPINLIHIVAFETTIRHILLIFTPTHTFRIQKIHNSSRRFIDARIQIPDDPMRTPAHTSNVVRLRRVRDRLVVCERNALRCQPGEIWVRCCHIIVCVLEPYVHESVECLALHGTRGRQRLGGRASCCDC